MNIYVKRLFLQLFVLSMLSLLIISCKESKEQAITYSTFPEEIQLQGTTHSLDTAIFRYPFRIRIMESRILIFDLHNSDYFYHSFILPNYQYELSFGKRGEGDEEIIISDDIRIGSENEIWGISNPMKQIWKYKIEDKGFIKREEVVKLDSSIIKSCNFIVYNENSFIIPDYSGKNRFLMIDHQGNVIKGFGYLPTLKYSKLLNDKPLLLGNPWFNYLNYNPNNNILVSVTQLGEVIEIYDLNTNKITIKYGPGGEPKFREVEENFGFPTEDGIRGFWDVKVTDQFIYALFDGRTFKEIFSESTLMEGGNLIYVFDLEGNPVKKYNLDCRISGFDLDEKTGVIYALNMNNDEPVTEFHLP